MRLATIDEIGFSYVNELIEMTVEEVPRDRLDVLLRYHFRESHFTAVVIEAHQVMYLLIDSVSRDVTASMICRDLRVRAQAQLLAQKYFTAVVQAAEHRHGGSSASTSSSLTVVMTRTTLGLQMVCLRLQHFLLPLQSRICLLSLNRLMVFSAAPPLLLLLLPHSRLFI
jgi:hypothetical protein